MFMDIVKKSFQCVGSTYLSLSINDPDYERIRNEWSGTICLKVIIDLTLKQEIPDASPDSLGEDEIEMFEITYNLAGTQNKILCIILFSGGEFACTMRNYLFP